MNFLPSITIVTPSLNAAATIKQTLDSVATQSYPGQIEHIVIDGGSTDGTLDVVREAGVPYVSEADRGLTHALNKGIDLSHSEIFAQLNADDFYFPSALIAAGEAFAAHPEQEWLTGRCVIVDADGHEIRRFVTLYKNLLLRHWSLPLHLSQNFVSAPTTFVRTSALRDIGGYDERFSHSMD